MHVCALHFEEAILVHAESGCKYLKHHVVPSKFELNWRTKMRDDENFKLTHIWVYKIFQKYLLRCLMSSKIIN